MKNRPKPGTRSYASNGTTRASKSKPSVKQLEDVNKALAEAPVVPTKELSKDKNKANVK